MPLTIPNLLTLARIATIPIFVVVYLLQPNYGWFATAIFLAAAITDWLDGYLARRMGVESAFGAFLDPVADKLIVCTALVLLVSNDYITSSVWSKPAFIIAVLIIVGREVSVAGLREWMAETGNRASIASNILAKIKTFTQMAAIVLLLYALPIADYPTLVIGEILLYIATAMTVWSMIVYLRIAWPALADRGDS